MEDNDEKEPGPATEVTLEPAESIEGYIVNVIVRDIPGEVKKFGPFPKDEAEMIGADILSGDMVLQFALLPPSIEAVIVEKEEVGEVAN